MSGVRSRQRRATLLSAAMILAALIVVGVLSTVGGQALYNSTEGRAAGNGLPTSSFPVTPNALIAGLDGRGRLASFSVFTLSPAGSGGSIVVLPVTADISGVVGDRQPLDAKIEASGLATVKQESQLAFGVTFDGVDVLDASGMADLLGDVSAVVELPSAVIADDGSVVAPAGSAQLDAESLAAVLTSNPAGRPGADSMPSVTAVWEAVAAARSGEETASSLPLADAASTVPTSSTSLESVADLVDRVLAGQVSVRAVATIGSAENESFDGLDVSLVDRADMALIFGQVSPGKVSALNRSFNVRVVVPYPDEQLAAAGLRQRDVALTTIRRLLIQGVNVVSVDLTPGPVPDVTTFDVATPDIVDDVSVAAPRAFPDADVRNATSRIAGVDVVVVAGASALDLFEPSASPVVSATDDPTSSSSTDDPTSSTEASTDD